MKKGSKNRAKTKDFLPKFSVKPLALAMGSMSNKLSLQYAENQGIVVVEDLKIKNMTKSAKKPPRLYFQNRFHFLHPLQYPYMFFLKDDLFLSKA